MLKCSRGSLRHSFSSFRQKVSFIRACSLGQQGVSHREDPTHLAGRRPDSWPRVGLGCRLGCFASLNKEKSHMYLDGNSGRR